MLQVTASAVERLGEQMHSLILLMRAQGAGTFAVWRSRALGVCHTLFPALSGFGSFFISLLTMGHWPPPQEEQDISQWSMDSQKSPPPRSV